MRIFISYAHESDEHKLRALQLADSLREHGVEAWIDQYVESPQEGWIRWMEERVENADKVLVVCSPAYLRRWKGQEEQGIGKGATWEAGLVSQTLYEAQGNNAKFIPVLFSREHEKCIPYPLNKGMHYVVETQEEYAELYRAITGQARVRVPRVGPQLWVAEQERRTLFQAPGKPAEPQAPESVPPAAEKKAVAEEPPPSTLEEILERHRELALRYSPLEREAGDPSAGVFASYSALFRQVLATDVPELRQGELLPALARFALDQPWDVLRVQGGSGCGKSSLLSLLYLYYRSCPVEEGERVVPFFLHLAEYDALPPEEALRRYRRDMASIESFIRETPDARFVLLVDGFDDYLDFRNGIEAEARRPGLPGLKRIVGIGLGIPSPYPPQKYRFEWDGTPAVTLQSPSPRSEKEVSALVDAFLRTRSSGNDEAAHRKLKRQLSDFQFSQLNLRTLALLGRLRERDTYRNIGSLFGLLECYCRERLAPEGAYEEVVPGVAALAYSHHYYGIKPLAEEQRGNRAWELIHHHADVRDFLLAYHVAHSLLGSARSGADLSVLKREFPYSITRHAKGILTRSARAQRQTLESARSALKSQDTNVRGNVAYFLGRITDDGIKPEAVELLRELLRVIKKEGRTDTDAFWLLRTIYVSLIYLGDRQASREYIQRLLDDQVWDRINRGFHLEYYGDIEVDPSSRYTHQDSCTAAFPKTFSRLHQSVRKNLRNRGHVPWELEVYTLYSLAQKRHAAGTLEPETRRELLALLDELLEERIDSDPLAEYLRMLRIHFQRESFSVGGLFEDLYRIKEEMRTGWVVRGIEDSEHVADHMYGAFLLGLLLLPAASAEPGYDKERILRTILIHDLAEAYTGDIVSQEKKERDRKVEAEWFSYLGMLGTYTELAGTREITELARAYEDRQDVNARIAHDLDKLDVYVQMHLYRGQGKIRDFEAWKREIARDLTPHGRRILALLKGHFEHGGGSAAGLRARSLPLPAVPA